MKRQKLMIKNETHWNTRDLRKLFLRCIKERGVYGKWWLYQLVISYSRSGGWIGGRGRYDFPWVRILLPGSTHLGGPIFSGLQEAGSAHIVRLAQVMIHEIDHNLNLHHEDMCSSWTLDVPWAENEHYIVSWNKPTKKTKEAKDKPTLQEKRAARAAIKLKEWESRQKRAAKLVKKWRQKVRYYDKALAKKAALPKEKSR